MRRRRRSSLSSVSGFLSHSSGPVVPADAVRLSSADPILHMSLKMLVELGGAPEFISGMGVYEHPDVAHALGLPPAPQNDEEEDTERDVVRQLLSGIKARYREVQHHRPDPACLPVELEANLAMLRDQLMLNTCEVKVLRFAVLLHSHEVLQTCAATLGSLSTERLMRILSRLLDEPVAAVKAALAYGAPLGELGFVKVDRHGNYEFSGKLEMVSRDFAANMLEATRDPMLLFRDVLLPTAEATLTLSHYKHMAEEVAMLRHVLADALAAGRHGVNVYLYGPPGTGKTELARLLARLLQVRAFEVSSEDRDGDPIGGVSRLQAWRAAQAVLCRRDTARPEALLIFDEAEDVFEGGTAQNRKAWMNRALENNAVPTIWLSNSIRGMDPAFVRRFDQFIEVKAPTKAQRRAMARAMLGEVASPDLVQRVAECEALTQAVLQRAASVSKRVVQRSAVKKGRSVSREQVLERLLDNTLRAQGHGGLPESDKDKGVLRGYDPAFIHADVDLGAVVQGLRKNPRGRLCLYGPPGTGKSAFVHYLARQLHLQVLEYHASDLLSPYVGMTEQGMAKAFAEARDKGAILLLDEIDSFLQSRSRAMRNWEVSMVNEMLTQMEHFDGLFVATTNLMEGLDAAAMRRFDLKVRFGYLRPVQATGMFLAFCRRHGIRKGTKPSSVEAAKLDVLTPGDFAAIGRRHRFAPLADGPAVLEALRQECALKPGMGRSMGFV
jgi:SpoVK/Ycf46/Vps4 family AAA+-type ATPase